MREIQDKLPWSMLFADDIVLIDVTRQGVSDTLERWRHSLESRGFKVSRSKTEYLHCCFSGRVDARGEVTLDGSLILKVDKFKYLGSIVQQNGDIDEDINHRIKVGWQKWRYSSSVLCDKRVPLGLKGKVYRMVVRLAVLYGLKCWPLKKTQVQRLTVAEMRMLRWMCGYTRIDRIRNAVIRDLVKVAPIDDTMRES